MNENLLLLAHPASKVTRGKKLKMARAISSEYADCEMKVVGPMGMMASNAPESAIIENGTAKKKSLSALAGITISLKSSLKRSAKDWKIPPTLPAYRGPTLYCIFASSFLSYQMTREARSEAKVSPGNVLILKSAEFAPRPIWLMYEFGSKGFILLGSNMYSASDQLIWLEQVRRLNPQENSTSDTYTM